ncbi:MAG: Stk1 family PASTA domain-containing Ser/Thr kinase [Acetatifactor sp.]|nr:Stk1 family PASTA domain-containing Ser/Thr kinase [Acetatifactor sp.]
MVKIGMMIGERYEILEKIGTGGMSDVYKGKDHKLNRFVAIKVLKQEFSENENFVSKFRIEAQAAAGLMHPNIVNVYDVGEENGIYYIVMELVEGITLKKYIEKKARLSYKEAVSIGIQVGMGIEAAHNNHIIHRDIKPQNIIISKDGKVKVTDFGIAKAATSNTITSNVMGSVHYTSPEQARGGYSDEKSDIYSLGITMFEMLTGRVPFNGETTVAIAIKHIQEEMPSPQEYVPEIPNSVESIVLKCCQKSPDRRYQSVQELVTDLKQSLINPDEDFVVVNDPDIEGGTRMLSDDDISRIKHRSVYQDDREYEEEDEPMRLLSDTAALYEEEEDLEEEDEYDYDPKMERVTTILAVVAGIVICIIIIILALKIFGNRGESDGLDSPVNTDETADTEYVDMPVVTGMNVTDAQSTLKDLGLEVNVVYEESETIDEDVVISADVSVGTSLQVGSTVTLTVSAGTEGIEIPYVVGMSVGEATSQLTSTGFLVNRTEGNSDTVEKDYVISQMPESGGKAPRGTVINIEVSIGQSRVNVPDLMRRPEDEARAMLIEAKLDIGNVSYVYSNEVEEGYVCYQSYSQGSYVDPGTPIDFRVSKGPESYTYRYNASIAAPTVDEAPDYESGSEVNVKLVTDGGNVLLDTRTSSFPVSANFYGLNSSAGTITITYTVTTTEPDSPPTTEERSFTRRVEFTRE